MHRGKFGKRTFVPENVKTIPEKAELKFVGEIFDVYQWPQEMFDGTRATFEMLRRADTVKIVAIITPGEKERLKDVVKIATFDRPGLLITYQRQPRKDWFYDFPGGRNDDPDEDELAAAKREMAEEAGMKFRDWKLIGVNQPFAKIDWLVYTFLASGLEEVSPQQLDGGEEIELQVIDFDELLSLANKNDAKYLRFKNYEKYRTIGDLANAAELYHYM